MTSFDFYMSAMKTVNELLRCRYCDDGGVCLRSDGMDFEKFRSLARGVVNNCNATMRRYSFGDTSESDHFVFSSGDLYCMVTIVDGRFASGVGVEILIRDDLLDFGEYCDDQQRLDAFFE